MFKITRKNKMLLGNFWKKIASTESEMLVRSCAKNWRKERSCPCEKDRHWNK